METPVVRPLIRLVHLVLKTERAEDFVAMLIQVAPQIRSMPGCLALEVWRDVDHPDRFVTMSRWVDHASLERYRSSAVFRATWTQIRPWFAERARASNFEEMEGLLLPGP